jgi:glutathione S-transferase
VKLYRSGGPNPRVVEIFLAQKGVSLETISIDIGSGENRRQPYLAKNPLGETPALELDGGEAISQVTAICEYLEERYPDPVLIGETPEERGRTRMWVRRIDLNIVHPLVSGFRYAEGLEFFKSRVHCIPQAAADLKALSDEGLGWLNRHGAFRPYICGERLRLADIFLFCFLDFGRQYGQPLNPEHGNVARWFDGIRERLAA